MVGVGVERLASLRRLEEEERRLGVRRFGSAGWVEEKREGMRWVRVKRFVEYVKMELAELMRKRT